MNSKRLVTIFGFVIILSLLAGYTYTGTSRAEFSSTNATLDLLWTYPGNESGDLMGFEVSNAGDLNDDGFADIAISAIKGSDDVDKEGVVHVFYGPVSPNNLQPDVTLSNDSKGSSFGYAISSGDLNCDGIDDLVIGAPEYKPGLEMPDAGIVYIYYGSAGGINTTADWSLVGPARDIYFGHAVAAGGDVTGDTCTDLAIGAPNDSNGETNEGRVYIYKGSATGPITSTVQILEANQPEALFGKEISIAGDVDNDGKEDVLIGAPSYPNREDLNNVLELAGAAFLYYGDNAGLNSDTWNWAKFGERSNDRFGMSLDSSGDINNDGCADVIIGAPYWDSVTFDNEGRVQGYMGSTTGLSTSSSWSATGQASYSKFGISVSTAGDITGDGIDDLVVGIPYSSSSTGGTGQDEPESIVVFEGTSSNFYANPSFTVTSNQSSTDFGEAVAIVASQSNDDVYADIIVGAPQYMRDDKTLVGQVFVYNGKATSGEAPLAVEMLFPLVLGAPVP